MSTRQRLIDATISLVRRRGVGGASVSEILELSGVARRTLYVNFPDGKPELVAAATTSAAAAYAAQLESLATERDPVRLVKAFTKTWETVLADSDYDAGCPIVAAALARSDAPAAADAAATAFTGWVGLLTQVGEASGLDRRASQDLATTVVAAIEGAVIMSVAARSCVPLQRAGRGLTTLVQAELAARKS